MNSKCLHLCAVFVALGAPTLAMAQPAADDQLAQVFSRYAAESLKPSPKRSGQPDNTQFYRFWEKEFRQVLASGQGQPKLRLRVLQELGLLQLNLKMTEEGMKTLRQMEAEAEKAGELLDGAKALASQFSHTFRQPYDQREPIAERYVGVFDRILKDDKLLSDPALRNQALAAYSRALFDTALVYQKEGLSRRQSTDAKKHATGKELLVKAAKQLREAVALGEVGTVPLELRLFHLGETQTALQDRDSAAETYDRLLKMKQSRISKLWIHELRTAARMPADSAEYRAEIARALEKSDSEGAIDKHALGLKLKLAQAYRTAKQYEESNRWLNQVVGAFKDNDYNAHALEMIAMNYDALGQAGLARDIRQQLSKQYPGTAHAEAAVTIRKRDEEAAKQAEEYNAHLKALKQHAKSASPEGISFTFILISASLVILIIGVTLFRRWRSRMLKA